MEEMKNASEVIHIKPVLVKNPWDGGMMTLKEFFEREDAEAEKDDKIDLPECLPPTGKTMYLNHIRVDTVAYQFLWYDAGTGYSSQSLFYRKQRGKNKFRPIAMECHIPEEYLFIVANAFEKGGVKAAQYALGVGE